MIKMYEELTPKKKNCTKNGFLFLIYQKKKQKGFLFLFFAETTMIETPMFAWPAHSDQLGGPIYPFSNYFCPNKFFFLVNLVGGKVHKSMEVDLYMGKAFLVARFHRQLIHVEKRKGFHFFLFVFLTRSPWIIKNSLKIHLFYVAHFFFENILFQSKMPIFI